MRLYASHANRGESIRRRSHDRSLASRRAGQETRRKSGFEIRLHFANEVQPISRIAGSPRLRGLDDAALDLIAFERFEQRLEVAFAETLVALALDELEEHGAEQRVGENLQQQPGAAAFGRTIEQNAARLQL